MERRGLISDQIRFCGGAPLNLGNPSPRRLARRIDIYGWAAIIGAVCASISIPGLVLDWRRQPDPLVDPLKIAFLGDFLLRRNLRVLRLGGTGKVVPIDPRCRDQTGYRAPTSLAALEGRVIHPVQRLVDDQAGRAFVLVNRHSLLLLLDARETWWPATAAGQTQQRRCARSDHVGSERALVAIPVGIALRRLEIPDARRVQAKNL